MQLLMKENDNSDNESSASLIADSDDCLRSRTEESKERKPMCIIVELGKKYPKLFYRKKYIGSRAVKPHYNIVFEIGNKFVQKCNDHWFTYFPSSSKVENQRLELRKYKLSYKDIEASYEMNYAVGA